MTAESGKCPLCDRDAQRFSSAEGYTFDCGRCGRFNISMELFQDIQSMSDVFESRYLLSGMTRWNTERALELITLMRSNVHSYISQYRGLGIRDKAYKLLEYLRMKTEYPGAGVKINKEIDYPVAFCRDPWELWYYVEDFSAASGLIKSVGSSEFRILPEGWKWLQEYGHVNVDSSKAFVAMWFDESTRAAYDNGIAPAVESAGYDAFRIDREEHVSKIDDEIIAQIRQSRFLVADFTGQRQGVYFEAGYAMGLDIPVIWLCRKDDVDKLHFDTRQYNHIIWKNPEDLQEQLKNRILAVVGEGPEKAK